MKNILFIHQSTELYGSSKTLFLLVSEFKKKGINPIVVIPDKGPLYDFLIRSNITVVVSPILKISRKMFGIGMIYTLPRELFQAIKKIDQSIIGLKIDLVYSNTLAVLIGIIYAKMRGIKHVWHIHEIIERPETARFIFQKFISLKTNSRIIYNSLSTKNFWETKHNKINSAVVLNGISKKEIKLDSDIDEVRKNLFKVSKSDLVIALVGRINKWKGQGLLIDALKEILERENGIKLIFVGSAPPGQEVFEEIINKKIDELNLGNKVRIIPFQSNIWPVWNAIDIAVVPSTLPEPFGLVSVEAMLSRKPVIAANHGGLSEIVVHNETGYLFEPNNPNQLKDLLLDLIYDVEKREQMGAKGYQRATEYFTLERYVNEIEDVCLTVLKT